MDVSKTGNEKREQRMEKGKIGTKQKIMKRQTDPWDMAMKK